jgi:hypothetical protein
MSDKIDELRATFERLRVQLAEFETEHEEHARKRECDQSQRIHELCETFARQMRELMGKPK